jgi:GT2 family glycosyltransferase
MLIIVIVSWNVCRLLRACLTSIDACACSRLRQQVIVVDNDSTDGSAEMVAREFPHVHLLRQPNNGFSAGNNAGLRLAETLWHAAADGEDYALLLNPDTVVSPGAFDSLVDAMRAHPRVGLIGPQLRYPDGTLQSSRRRFPTLEVARYESTWAAARAPHGLFDFYYMRDVPDDQPCEVDWVVGAAMLVRREVYERVGPLDEHTFFMYSEETDWCKRIHDAGWAVRYEPSACIVHHEGGSSTQASARRMVLFNTSKVRFFRKHFGVEQADALRQCLLAQFRREIFLETLKMLLGHKSAMRRERIGAYRAVLKSNLV